jgi:hypothetical protein
MASLPCSSKGRAPVTIVHIRRFARFADVAAPPIAVVDAAVRRRRLHVGRCLRE